MWVRSTLSLQQSRLLGHGVQPLEHGMSQDDWSTFVGANDFSKLGVGVPPDWFVENEPRNWMSQIRCDRDTAIKIAIAVIDQVLPEWQQNHPDDTVPVRAVDAARKYLAGGQADLKKHAKALSKGCSDSRKRSMGYYHRIAEAARAVANTVSASTESAVISAVGDALSKTEEHILYRYAVDAIYGKETEVRRTMFSRVIEVLES
jgi:hypothetical protein